MPSLSCLARCFAQLCRKHFSPDTVPEETVVHPQRLHRCPDGPEAPVRSSAERVAVGILVVLGYEVLSQVS